MGNPGRHAEQPSRAPAHPSSETPSAGLGIAQAAVTYAPLPRQKPHLRSSSIQIVVSKLQGNEQILLFLVSPFRALLAEFSYQ